MLNNAVEIRKRVVQALERQEMKHRFSDDMERIRITYGAEGKLKSVMISIIFADFGFSIRAYIDIDADEDSRIRVAEYVNRINYRIRRGNFQMDFNDGEICFRDFIDCRERDDISDELIRYYIEYPVNVFEEYGDGFLAVMYGIKSPEDALKDMDKDDSAPQINKCSNCDSEVPAGGKFCASCGNKLS